MMESDARITKDEIRRRLSSLMQVAIEEILEEEMSEQLQAGFREHTPTRQGERNGHYHRSLVTESGKIEQLRVPRRREGEFLTEVFERYQRLTGNVEEAVLEMYLQGVSTRKVGEITQALSRVRIGKDAVSRIAQRLDEDLSQWRDQVLSLAYPYLYLDATVLKVNWGGRVVDLHLLVAIGVNENGYREVLAVESAGGEKKEAYRNLLKGLLERGLHGVQLVISDDHKSIQAAVRAELSDALWQRCVVHFQRNVLAHVPSKQMKSVAADLKAVFAVGKEETARRLAREFIEQHGKTYPKAIETLQGGLDDVLTYLQFPSSHYRLIRTTNPLERLFREVKRRTRVVGVFPNETSAVSLATTVMLRVTERRRLRRYMEMTPLEAMNSSPR